VYADSIVDNANLQQHELEERRLSLTSGNDDKADSPKRAPRIAKETMVPIIGSVSTEPLSQGRVLLKADEGNSTDRTTNEIPVSENALLGAALKRITCSGGRGNGSEKLNHAELEALKPVYRRGGARAVELALKRIARAQGLPKMSFELSRSEIASLKRNDGEW
jgi:hypothetical protein